jgi:hypothetical protein
MALTTAQLQALATDIAASEFSGLPQNSDSADQIAKAYNLDASPDFTVWKTNGPLDDIGLNFDASEVETLSGLENDRLETFATYSPNGVNPSRIDHRNFYDGVFAGAGGANTRANLLILWKRLARRIEQLYATGTGSDPDPAQLVYEGTIGYRDVLAAWAA